METRPERCQGKDRAAGERFLNRPWIAGIARCGAVLLPFLFPAAFVEGATPRYEVGELAEENIYAPTAMAVVDMARTEVLREQAARRIPAVFRFHSQAAGDAIGELRLSFEAVRARFLESMRAASKRDRLDEPTLAHPSFRRFVIWFQEQNPAFPLTADLARLWASGDPGNTVLAAWNDRLRAAMERCVHGDWLPPEFTGGLRYARLVQVDDPGEVLTLKSVDSRGVEIRLTNLVSISRSRALMKQAGPEAEEARAVGNYLAGFLQVNCFPEEELTRRIREQSTTDMVAVDRYQEGQLLVRRGQRVDARIKTALEFLAQTEKPSRSRPVSGALAENRRETSPAGWWRSWMANPLRFEAVTRQSLVLAAGAAMVFLLFLAVLVRRKGVTKQKKLAAGSEPYPAYTVVMNEERNETVFLPLEASAGMESVTAAGGSSALAPAEGSPDAFWRRRAMAAERRAEDILNMVRAGLAPQLARQMMSKLVQELITQRAEWLETSKIAENELADIERRFTHSHAVLQQRLRDFEKRAEELERQLALKTEENSELIKTQIALTQKQLREAQEALDSDKKVLLWN